MKLVSIILVVFLLVGSAFPTTTDDSIIRLGKSIDHLHKIAANAMDAVDEAIKMSARLKELGDPRVDAIVNDGLDRMKEKLNAK